LTYNVDYTIAGTTLTFLSDPPCPTDGILFYGSLGYTVIPATITVSGDTSSYTEIDYLHFVNTIVSNPSLGVAKIIPKTSVLGKIKSIDESKNNSTTASNDSELIFSLESGGNYQFQFFVMGTTSAAADIKFTINFDGTSQIRFGGFYKTIGLATVASFNSITSPGTTVANLGGGGQFMVELKGSINSTTAGTLGFGWAQNTSDAGPTTVYANSYGLVFKVN